MDYFVHYGPPFNEEYGGCLYEECNMPRSSLFEIHILLNEGGDPRVGNPDDHNNTPMHYACRYCNLRLCKMLRRASAHPQQVNDLGQSSLTVACMFNAPEPRYKKHLKLITWLLDNEALINHVDKGGHTALELASSWGNLRLVTLLIQRGAKVLRDTQYLSIKSPDAVEVAANVQVRDLVSAKRKKEVAERRKIVDERKRLADLKASIAAERKRREIMQGKVESRKRERARRLQVRTMWPKLSPAHKSLPNAATHMGGAIDSPPVVSHGMWKKKQPGAWIFQPGIFPEVQTTNGLKEVQAFVHDAARAEHSNALQRRWRSITGLDLTPTHPIMMPHAYSLIPGESLGDRCSAPSGPQELSAS